MKKHKAILVTAPSGAGKTTLVKKLLAEFSQFEFSISATTRAPRVNEADGKDYYYISEHDFDYKIKNNEFLEWEEVYSGTKYGTLKSELDKITERNKIPIFDIDVKGALKVKKMMHEEILSIFIAPPSIEELAKRLSSRNTDTADKIKVRINKASEEMQFQNLFDKKIVNEDIEASYSLLKKYIFDYLEQ